MNTQYVVNGSCIDPDRYSKWSTLSDTEKQEIVELYLVHWRDLSYLHCSWESEAMLTQREGPHMKQKFQVFLSEREVDSRGFIVVNTSF